MRILAIDQGTSATKALVQDSDGSILGCVEEPVAVLGGAPGAIEHDPEALWQSVVRAGRRVLNQVGVTVDAIGLANQGETVLAWDRATGNPLTAAISWQDRRSLDVTERLEPHRSVLHNLTGLPLDPYFAAPKMTFIRERISRDGVVTTSDSWLVHRMTGIFATDAATASRTMLLDLDSTAWSDKACAIFGLDDELPAVLDSAGLVGETDTFGPSLPLTALCVDQQAALYGQSRLARGEAKCTYGTGAFLLINSGEQVVRSHTGLAASVAWRFAGLSTYCLDGQVYAAGSAVDWLTRIGLLDHAADLDTVATLEPDANGVVFVPALSGLGAPFWQPEVRASFSGIDLQTRRGHLLRAVAEGIAASVVLLVAAAVDDIGRPLESLPVDGGLTQSSVVMQAQADLMQLPVQVFHTPHATALGIAAIARKGAGTAGDPRMPAPERIYEPRISADEATLRMERFRAALKERA